MFFINFFTFLTLLFFTLIIFIYSFVAINSSYKTFQENDPQEIVIDEVVGQMLPLLTIPVYETLCLAPKEYYCVAAFIFFRLFDIWKPFPINYVENNTSGALGIMLDDVIAGLYTIITLTIIFFFLGA